MLPSLDKKNDLGIDSLMFSDGAVDLIRNGNISDSRKTINRGMAIATFPMGAKRLSISRIRAGGRTDIARPDCRPALTEALGKASSAIAA